MAKPYKKAAAKDQLDMDAVFSGPVADMRLRTTDHPENRNLELELFGKKGVHGVIDRFEEHMGFAKPKKAEPKKIHNKVLAPAYEEDRLLLVELMNDPKFKIVMWKDTWTVNGDYKIFVIYSESLAAPAKPDQEPNE